MASVVLTAAGAFIGGPIGAAIGAVVGSEIDRRVLFKPKGREGPRLTDLSVQGSDYGAPLARHYGTVRSAGTVIWTSGLKETAHRSGGGKRSGGRTTSYSYSASFAIAIAAREIGRVGRIWADGKLLRGAAGNLLAGGTVRTYRGTERQEPDPLIEASLGPGMAPAYRGLAYLVFDGLELADFANRIPNISAEIFADEGVADAAAIAADLVNVVDGRVVAGESGRAVTGFSVANSADVAGVVGSLDVIAPMSVIAMPEGLRFSSRMMGQTELVSADRLMADKSGAVHVGDRSRLGERGLPSAFTLAANDPERDYQPSVQRAIRSQALGSGERHFDVAASLNAAEAKRVAEAHLSDLWARRSEARRRLPIRYISLMPGDIVNIAGDGEWHVRQVEVEGLSVAVQLERRRGTMLALPNADAGDSLPQLDVPQGATMSHVMELPPIGGEGDADPRVWIAAGGASAGWRRAEIWISGDGGESWRSIGVVSTPSLMGTAASALPAAATAGWDETSRLTVELLDDQVLTGTTASAVLGGQNLALVGEELVQFRDAVQTGPKLWELSGLLRGRRGTEAAAASHAANERFVLLEPEVLFPLDFALSDIGRTLLVKAVGPADSLPTAPEVSLAISGRSLRPLSPVHLSVLRSADGDLTVHWIRRSRRGFGWPDGSDVPLAEENEVYRVEIAASGDVRTFHVDREEFTYTLSQQQADFGGSLGSAILTVRQVSQSVGAGDAAELSF
ncbi:phage tail protein [Pacificimonas sp. WHA3]|uniref:Phage tail protein n=1 Tax=Pacificimonas pallii TaxID=2827236 RepID=A0ABS6SAS7_9SPHN|nr:phage tail protein [Pacificimonas pallii]MBV7255198.1 phage tail protein [Pacificimonas pallii]